MRVLFESTVRRLASLRPLSMAAALATAGAVIALSLSCQAPIKQKKGYQGDFCNGQDDHCRSGLVCEDGICTSLNNAPDVCSTVCGRYDECGVAVSSCRPSCLKTLREWREDVTSQYESCHEDAQCSTLEGRDDPWNYCYNRLPEAPSSRLQVCDKLERKSNSCMASADIEPKGRVDNMKSECRTEARTIPDDKWEKNARCAEQNDCRRLFKCLNKFLELEDGDKLPTSPNG